MLYVVICDGGAFLLSYAVMVEHLDPIVVGAVVIAAVVATIAILFWRVRRRGRHSILATSEPTAAEETSAAAPAPAAGWDAFRVGLSKTRQVLGDQLRAVLRRDGSLEARLADLEEALILADVGMPTTQRLLSALRRRPGLDSADALFDALRGEIQVLLSDGVSTEPEARPLVMIVAGVNGVGKTTTIGKLAYRYRQEGKRVMVIAADTFRAAAIEQLEVWAKRVDCDFVKHQHGADPAAVVYDGIKAARARGTDVAIIDTAGRLHVKVNLMEKLKKLVRVIRREIPDAPHESFLVIDATTGQNAINQARVFKDALPLTGIVLTKLDGTAKGGAALAVRSELGLPIRYVGLGERLEDLRPFDAETFTRALFESDAR